MPTRIILDTDLGDDIDDAIALGLIIASPELDLVGVTTVYGNTEARGRQARTILAIAGGRWASVPVADGCGGTMSARLWRGYAMYLERELPNQDAASWPAERLPPLDRRHAIDFLIDTIMAGDGDIVPVTIGAMTNLAMAIVREPRIVARIPRVVAMAGEFQRPFTEWNVKCDVEACAIVVRSGIRIDWTPWLVGKLATWTQTHVDRLATGGPLAKHLHRTIVAWRRGQDTLPCLYDPLAVATIFRPELCTWKRGLVEVETQGGRTYGFTSFTEDPGDAAQPGPHRVAWDVDKDTALDVVLDRLVAC